MATQAKDILAKVRRGEQISDAERSILEAEAARVTQQAGVDQALGRQTPPAQVAPEQPAGLGDMFASGVQYAVNPVAQWSDLIGGLRNAGPAAQSFYEMTRGDVPPEMEGAGEFEFGSERLPGPLGALAQIAPSGGLPQIGRNIAAVFTGDEDPMNEMQARLGFMMDRRPEARQDILADAYGDQVSFSEDSLGNLLVDLQGQGPAYLNAPGFSMQDAQDIATDAVAFTPTGRVFNLGRHAATQAPTLMSRLGRGLLTWLAGGATAAGTEAGRQTLGSVFGSEQDVDPADVLLAGSTAGIGERVLPGGSRWTREARDLLREADDLGLNLRGGPGEQVLQTRQAAQNAGQRPLAGTLEPGQGRTASVGYTGFSDIQPRVQARRQQELDRVNALYDDPETGARVRGRDAFVGTGEVRSLNDRVQQSVQNLDLPPEGATRRLLNQMDEVAQIENGRVRVTPMEEWRRNVNARLDTLGNPTDAAGRQERRALINAKREYDTFMDEQFARDMVSGDEGAIQAWREAREGWQDYVSRFEEDRFLQTLAQNDMLNPTEIRNLIFGAGKLPTSAKSVGPAEKTVKRLNSIFGPDSNEMQAIRAEVAADVTAPLFGNTPDIGKFVDNFDTMMRQNRPLMEELWPNNLEDGLELVKYAKTIRNRRGARAPGPLDPAVERMWNLANAWAVGHNLARGQARLNLSRGLIDKIRQAGGGSMARRKILHEALGTDPTQRIIPFGTGAVAGATAQNAMDERNRTREPVGERPAVQVDPAQAEQTNIRSIMNKARKNPEALTARERQILQQEARRVLEAQGEG